MLTGERLAIDFGASYTKVAYRPPLDEQKFQNRAAGQSARVFLTPTLVPTHQARTLARVAWVPSIVAHDTKHDRWHIGYAAAGMRGTEGVRVYSNWKRDLFHDPRSP